MNVEKLHCEPFYQINAIKLGLMSHIYLDKNNDFAIYDSRTTDEYKMEKKNFFNFLKTTLLFLLNCQYEYESQSDSLTNHC